VDGELVAIDENGRPDFYLFQNFRAEASRIQYHVFDLLCWKDRDLTRVPLVGFGIQSSDCVRTRICEK
jgi:ATP-dependent DNA ligase